LKKKEVEREREKEKKRRIDELEGRARRHAMTMVDRFLGVGELEASMAFHTSAFNP
jgi:hypothetical protein